MRHEAFSVSLGIVAAVALISALTSLRTASPPEAATEMLTVEYSASKTVRAPEESLRDGSAYLLILLSLLSAALVYQASSGLLERQRLI
ncbi:MAG: hypothetical protein QXT81_00915 [Candidatus Bathyarchaeia archaeon]